MWPRKGIRIRDSFSVCLIDFNRNESIKQSFSHKCYEIKCFEKISLRAVGKLA